MRLLITADPYLPVPPAGYGGIERVIAILVDGLAARGHDVTLVAHPGSRTRGQLVPYGMPPHKGAIVRARELTSLAAKVWSRRRSIDLVHSFGRLAALAPVLPIRSLPKLQSYQRQIPWGGTERAAMLAGDSILFAACSTAMYGEAPKRVRSRWRTVFNAVDTRRLTARVDVASDAPLLFLGRLEAIKGPHHAIAIARRSGRRLVIAGNIVPESARYFEEAIKPHIDDETVRFAGEVDDAWKAEHVGRAAALLMPIEWDEPFGIVMAEALACGTPVIGFARGSVPEVVRHGVTGFVCRGVDDAVDAVARLGAIDRRECRRDAEARFGPGALVDGYEGLYAELRS